MDKLLYSLFFHILQYQKYSDTYLLVTQPWLKCWSIITFKKCWHALMFDRTEFSSLSEPLTVDVSTCSTVICQDMWLMWSCCSQLCFKSHELLPFVFRFLSSISVQCSYPPLLCVLMACSDPPVVIPITLTGSLQSFSGLISWRHFRGMYADGMWRDTYCHYKEKLAIVMIPFYTVNFLYDWGTLLWHNSTV